MSTMLPEDSGPGPDSFLASAEEIARLLQGAPEVRKPAAADARPRPPAPPHHSPAGLRPAAAPSRLRCHCGHCPYCLDNARWERIFNEKFADPSYYRRLALRYNSTLAEPR